jgi:uncharacterized membrane protein
MSDVPTQVVVGVFRDEQGADAALADLTPAQKEQRFRILDAAVLHRSADGKLHVKEVVGDMHGGKGALFGGVSGAVIGVLAGPIGWAAGVGAVAGGLAAKLRDSGFKDERLRKLGEGLTPGASALVVVVEYTRVDRVEAILAEAGADLLTEQIQKDIAAQLEAGRDIAYAALASTGAVESTGGAGATAETASSAVVTPKNDAPAVGTSAPGEEASPTA